MDERVLEWLNSRYWVPPDGLRCPFWRVAYRAWLNRFYPCS